MDKPNLVKILIEDKIPDEIRSFLPVICNIELDEELEKENIKALLEAIELINEKLHLNRLVPIIIGKSPFKITLKSGTFIYAMKTNVINSFAENFIFFDFNNMRKLPFPIKVAYILEEFVHAIMNVSEELLTAKIVNLLYPAVSITPAGRYEVYVRHKL